MRKRTKIDVIHNILRIKRIDDLEGFITDIKRKSLDAGVKISRVELAIDGYSNVVVGFYKPLTPEELKKLEEEEKIAAKNKAEKLALLEKEKADKKAREIAESEKRSAAAKKGWEKRNIIKAEQERKNAIFRAEKIAKAEEERKAKEFLRKILEEED